MSIVSRLINRPESFSIEMLQRGVQSGTIPAYIGIPLIQEKLKDKQEIENATAPKGPMPPVADQVMAQATQATTAPPPGLMGLRSNLPAKFAGGGIVSFADGGSARMAKMLLEDDEEADDDYIEAIMGAMEEMDAMRARAAEASPDVAMIPESMTETREGVSVKMGDRPAKTIEHRVVSESKPAGDKKGLDELIELVKQKESGGRRYGPSGELLTSPKGAMGEMQVMPGTARDPGFGIRPARSGDPDDLARVGREYFARMLERYGDPKIAAVAYNWGPGNTDKWLMAGADPKDLPAETRSYMRGFAEGGIVSLQGGGVPPLSVHGPLNLDEMTPEERMRELARRRLKMEQARAAFEKAPSAAAAAPAAAPSSGAPSKSLLDRILYGAGRFLGETVKSPASRAAGITGLAYSAPTNVGEAEELARRRAMPPTIDVPAGQLPREFPAVQQQAGAPPRMEKPQPATQTYTRAEGPTAEELAQFAREQDVSAARDQEDREMAAAMQAMAAAAPGAAKQEGAKEPEGLASLRKYIEEGRAETKKQRDIDKYMALFQAGLGMMGGSSRFASENIGRGALMGAQAYQEAAKQRSAEERGLLQAQLGLERYSQLGALQREQAQMRKDLATAEATRKTEAAQASLAEREKKRFADQLSEIEKLAQQRALAQYKGAILPEQKDQILAQAKMDLLSDPAYRQLYKRVYGFEPSGGVKTYDPKTGQLR